jgi:hypothetical protein
MPQRQSSVAAFIHYCLLVCHGPELLQGVLSGAEASELSELVEVLISWCFLQFVLDPMSLVWLLAGGPVALFWSC